MYWLPNMHKTSIGSRFIVASKTCSTKPLSETTSKIFKMIFNTSKIFDEKSFFYSRCKKSWAAKNYFSHFPMSRKKLNLFQPLTLAPYIQTLVPYIQTSFNLVFKSKVRKCIRFSKISIFRLLRELGKDTSLNKVLPILCISS